MIDFATEPRIRPSDIAAQTSPALLRRFWRDAKALAALDAQLARHELGEKARAGRNVVGFAGVGFAFGAVALLCLTAALVEWLGSSVGLGLAALIFAAIWGVVAALCALSARRTYEAAGGASLPHVEETLFGWADHSRLGELSIAELQGRIDDTRKRIDESVAALQRKDSLLPPLRDTAVSVASLGVALSAILNEKADERHR